MLVHGIAGWDSLGNIVDYFHAVPHALTKDGAKVCIAAVSSFASSFDRAAQLAPQVKQCAQKYGAAKVNIMAHSQGSPTARILLNYGDTRNYIASITSINGVNKGSKVADFIRGVLPEGSLVEASAATIANALGDLIDAISSDGQDLRQSSVDALETLTTEGTKQVNNYTPWGVNTSSYCAKSSEDHNVHGQNIKLFSWTGDNATTNILDISDPFIKLTSLVFINEKSDGLVGVCSSYLGKVIGDSYHMNHLDAQNQVLGIHGWTEPKTLYRKHANRLKGKGL
jgi:triacylglycerol lipase